MSYPGQSHGLSDKYWLTRSEPADAYYFNSLGELNENIPDVHLALLLKRKLKKVRERIAKDRRRR